MTTQTQNTQTPPAGGNNQAEQVQDKVKQNKNQDIFTQLGIGNLPIEDKKRLGNQFAAVVHKAVISRLVQSLDPAILPEFDRLIDGGDGDKINQFLQKHLPNAKEIAQEEAERLKTQLVGDTQQIVQTLADKK